MKVVLRSTIVIIYILSFSVILHNTTFAQAPEIQWIKTFGNSLDDRSYSVQQTTDGGYIVVGSTVSNTTALDLWLIKTDSNGDTMWTKTFGGDSSDVGNSVQQTFDDGYIITGYTKSFGVGKDDVWLIRINSNGDTLWTKTFGDSSNDRGYSVQQTNDGGYIIAGYTESFILYGATDYLLIKTDSNGDTIWTKTNSDAGTNAGYSIQQTTDGGYIIAGEKDRFFDNGFDIDAQLFKTDANGDIVWTRTFDGYADVRRDIDRGNSVQQTSDGGYIMTGFTRYRGSRNIPDLWLIKTDNEGDTLWTKTFSDKLDTLYWEEGESVQQTTDGGYIITGFTESLGAGNDIWLIKTNSNGDTLWTKTFGDSSNDRGYSVQQTNDGGYIIAGNTESFGAGGSDVWLIKIAADITSIEKNTHVSLNEYQLLQNHPNPFNPSTTIEFTLPKSEFVVLKVYNILGKEVKTLVSKKLNQGNHTYTFDGNNLASGIYYYQLVAGDYREVKKMIYLK